MGRSGQIPVLVTSTGNLSTALRRMTGWSFRETAGSTASVVLRDGGSGGDIVASIALAANGSETVSELDLMFSKGTPHATVTGTIEGAVYGTI